MAFQVPPTKQVFPLKTPLPVDSGYSALMTIDMQYVDAHPDYGMLAQAREMGLSDAFSYYEERLGTIVPNIQRLQRCFRDAALELVHVHIESVSRDGRDRGDFYKSLGLGAGRGTKEAEFIAEVAPEGDEIIISKTSSSPFNSSNIDQVLRHVGIRQLFVTGVMTSGCVESTVRDAADRGYDVVLVTDACAARTADMEQKTHDALGATFASLLDTDSVIQLIEQYRR